jgi:hypothetical protein
MSSNAIGSHRKLLSDQSRHLLFDAGQLGLSDKRWR